VCAKIKKKNNSGAKGLRKKYNSSCFYGCNVDLHTLVIRDYQQNKQIISYNF